MSTKHDSGNDESADESWTDRAGPHPLVETFHEILLHFDGGLLHV